MRHGFTMASRRTNTRYQDMNKFKVRVQYNSMGEPVKTKVCVDNLRQGRNIRRKPMDTVATTSTHCELTSKVQSHQEDEHLSHSASNLTRVTCVLREILFGKVGRDMIHSQSHFASLPDVLRFYCRTTFGAMAIAEQRRIDLFHTILVLQSSSPLLRVMKRLLHIPGIKPFCHRLSTVYFEIWAWLIENDAIADVNDAKNTLDLLIPSTVLLQCIETIGIMNGNQFSPMLFSRLREYIQCMTKCSPPPIEMRCQDDASFEWINVDTALEGVLNLIEKEDGTVEEIRNQLFSKKLALGVILPSTTSDETDTMDNISANRSPQKRVNMEPIASLQLLLHNFISLDPNRDGILKDDDFCNVLREWYEGSCNIIYANKDHCDELLDCFDASSKAEDGGLVDYISFFSTLSTFILEEHRIPNIKETETYIHNSFRGVDRYHLDCLQKYVKTARLKMDSNLPIVKAAASERRRIVNSRRALSRIRPYQNGSDFFTQWVGAAACSRGDHEYPDERVDTCDISPLEDEEGMGSSGTPSTSRARAKTPLHLIQPLQDSTFERDLDREEHVDTIQNASITNCHLREPSKNKSKVFDISPDGETPMGREPTGSTDGSSCHHVGTNIYVRFPEVEPIRTVLGKDQAEGVHQESSPPPNGEWGGHRSNVGVLLGSEYERTKTFLPSCQNMNCKQAIIGESHPPISSSENINRRRDSKTTLRQKASKVFSSKKLPTNTMANLPNDDTEPRAKASIPVSINNKLHEIAMDIDHNPSSSPLSPSPSNDIAPATRVKMNRISDHTNLEDLVKYEKSLYTNCPLQPSVPLQASNGAQSGRDHNCNSYASKANDSSAVGHEVLLPLDKTVTYTDKTETRNIGNPNDVTPATIQLINDIDTMNFLGGLDPTDSADENHMSNGPFRSPVPYGPSIPPTMTTTIIKALDHYVLISGVPIPRSIKIPKSIHSPLDSLILYLRAFTQMGIFKLGIMRGNTYIPLEHLKTFHHPTTDAKGDDEGMVIISVHQKQYPLPKNENTSSIQGTSSLENVDGKNTVASHNNRVIQNDTELIDECKDHETSSHMLVLTEPPQKLALLARDTLPMSGLALSDHVDSENLVNLWLIDRWLWDEYFESSTSILHQKADYSHNREVLKRLFDCKILFTEKRSDMRQRDKTQSMANGKRSVAENNSGGESQKSKHCCSTRSSSNPRQTSTSFRCKPRQYCTIRPVAYRIR